MAQQASGDSFAPVLPTIDTPILPAPTATEITEIAHSGPTLAIFSRIFSWTAWWNAPTRMAVAQCLSFSRSDLLLRRRAVVGVSIFSALTFLPF